MIPKKGPGEHLLAPLHKRHCSCAVVLSGSFIAHGAQPRLRPRFWISRLLASHWTFTYSSSPDILMITPGTPEAGRANANLGAWSCINVSTLQRMRPCRIGRGTTHGITPGGAMQISCLVSTAWPWMVAPRWRTRRGKLNGLGLMLSFSHAPLMPRSAECSTAIGISMQ